jgi:hypothetical protein
MNFLAHFFLIGLAAGVPIWIVWQLFRPRIGGLPVLRHRDIVAMDIKPVVLNSRFVADVARNLE